MAEKPVKNLLGSISFGIRLEILGTFEKLQDIFVRIEMFDRRRKIKEVIVDNFELLVENITEFWEKEAQLGLYPRKTAVWLSDYLEELGYPAFDYDYVYKAITNKLEEQSELEKLAKLIELKDPDVKPKIRKLDLDLPKTGRGTYLAEEIDNFLEEAPKTTKSSIIYVDQEGKLSTLMTEQDIVQKSDEEKTELLTTTTFDNPLDIPITDVQINNIIPYHYKVMGIETIGFEGIEPIKKLLDDGLQLTWIIPEIKPKQETKIEVNLERRISRTILMNIAADVNIINTYFNIEPYKDRFSATNSFVNVQSDIIDHLIIEDEIPTTFNLLEVKPPDEDYTMNMEKQGFEQLLKWQYTEIATEKEIRHLYYLIDRQFFIFSRITVKSKQDETLLLEVNRLIEPNTRYYELIITYYLRLYKKIPELYIKEQVPEGVNVTFVYPQNIDKSIEISGDKTKQVWKIVPYVPSDKFQFGYIISGQKIKTEFPIELVIPEFQVSTSNPISSEFNKQPIFLPEIHQFLQNHKALPDIS
ncbi:MAG: hypothetical protein EU536_01455 [Promethearchaeota archaeon]|nr:MAG: hypothetical protein EU536_01455 [Candidatus Lokiarchaeota archaeon]